MRAQMRGATVAGSGLRSRLSLHAMRLALAVGRAVRRRSVLIATIVGCALYLAAASSPTTGLWSRNWQYQGDLAVYQDYAQRVLDGEVPYRDFQIEYPPASLFVFVPPLLLRNAVAHLGVPGVAYEDVFKGLMLALGLAIVAIVATTARLWNGPGR